jgi:hypothetical protein
MDDGRQTRYLSLPRRGNHRPGHAAEERNTLKLFKINGALSGHKLSRLAAMQSSLTLSPRARYYISNASPALPKQFVRAPRV